MTRPTTLGSACTSSLPLCKAAQEVAGTSQIARPTVDCLVAAGELPQPVKFTRKTVRWLRADIESLHTQSVRGE